MRCEVDIVEIHTDIMNIPPPGHEDDIAHTVMNEDPRSSIDEGQPANTGVRSGMKIVTPGIHPGKATIGNSRGESRTENCESARKEGAAHTLMVSARTEAESHQPKQTDVRPGAVEPKAGEVASSVTPVDPRLRQTRLWPRVPVCTR